MCSGRQGGLDVLLARKIGKQPDVLTKDAGKFPRRPFPDPGVGPGQAVERLCLRQLLAIDREREVGDGLIEETHPGASLHDGEFVEHRLGLVGAV